MSAKSSIRDTAIRFVLLRCTVGDMEFGVEIGAVLRVEGHLHIGGNCGAVDEPYGIHGGVYGIDTARLFLGEQTHTWSDAAKDIVLLYQNQTFAMTADSVIGLYTARVDELTTWYDPPDHPATPFVRAFLPMADGILYVVNLRSVLRYIDTIDGEGDVTDEASMERSEFNG
ncbi:MAG TPA: hypothetical protein ENN56_00055 [Firmicutes bacterium]|nr:hypothetical protein [Bacillota bacterium]